MQPVISRVAYRMEFVRIVRKLTIACSGNRNKVKPDSILSGKLGIVELNIEFAVLLSVLLLPLSY